MDNNSTNEPTPPIPQSTNPPQATPMPQAAENIPAQTVAVSQTEQATMPTVVISTPPTKKKSPILLLILLILFLLLILGGGFWYWQNQGSNNQIPAETQPTITPLPSASPTPDPTANWETYTDSQGRFSLKHPGLDSNCCSIAGPLDVTQAIVVLANKSTALPETDDPFDGFAIYVNENSTNTSFEDYLSERKVALLDNFQEVGGEEPSGPAETAFLLDGQQGVKLTGYTWWNADLYFVPFPRGNQILIIAKGDDTGDSFEQTFQQILSTFEFLDK